MFRTAISQASCQRLPAFQFDYWLTGIADSIAGNNVKIQADFLSLNVDEIKNTPLMCIPSLELSTWQEVIDFLLDTQCIQQTSYD